MSAYRQKGFNGDPGHTILFNEMFEPMPHLWVVVTAPDGTPPCAVIVNLTSQRSHSDTTVVLRPGDHPFIKHPTVVNYKDARLESIERLKQEIEINIASAHYPFEPDVLKLIQNGVLQSRFTPREIKQYCADRF